MEEVFLKTLEERYLSELYYTLQGERHLIFVDPQLDLEQLNEDDISRFYLTCPFATNCEQPHIYGFAQHVLRQLLCTSRSQTVSFM
jgi:myosin heavy subunit